MESLEEMQTRHRKEQKDLQSRITQKKKNASKKTRKGVNAECEDLERQLKEKHSQELAALNGDLIEPSELEDPVNGELGETRENGVNGIADKMTETSLSEPADEEEENGDVLGSESGSGSGSGTGTGTGQPKKRNRAKERLARRAAETAAAIESAKLEAQSQPDIKELERKKISVQIESNGLVERLIRPDGHCLFSAVADQLQQVGVPLGTDGNEGEGERYKVVRERAAGYMEGHPGEFEGWLEEPLEEHVEKIRGTAEWGGHLELLALARVYGVEICVLQDGPMQVVEPGEEGKKDKEEKEKIWLAYYRHGFGLGEHYNSLRKAP
ncbi:hypothetical protein EG329_002833 [Mollisiaceae sp. DMI_Dod_QoI]|nr:hypothetical protein EG329_002833 [Helotiales sp. DMI_Dod_QoI]